MNSFNQKPEFRIEEGITIAAISFLLISLLFAYLLWNVKIPFTNDILWKNWPLLPKALCGYTLSTLGIQTNSWLNIETTLNISGYKTFFLLHFYIPMVLALPISIYLGYLVAKPVDRYHARGPVLLSGSDAVMYAKRKIKMINGKSKAVALLPSLLIHPKIRLPFGMETKGLAVIGGPSSGKSQIITPVILDSLVQQPLAKGVVLDNKGDFTQTLNETQSIITTPLDRRGDAWFAGQDVRTELDAKLLAQVLVPEIKGENSVFSDASRVLLTGYLMCLMGKYGTNWNLGSLTECFLWSTGQNITELGKYYPFALKIFRENSKSTDSVEFTIMSNLSHVRQFAQAWPSTNSGLSLRSWIKDNSQEKPILILQANKAFPEISDTYISIVLTFLSHLILSPALPDSSARRIYFFLDEIAQIPQIKQLKNLAALGRSKGVCICLGIQDIDLLVDNYGQQEVNSLIGMMQTKIILSMGSGPGAEYASKLLGDREIFTHDFDEIGNRIPVTQTQRLVTSSEISQLPQPTLQSGIHGWMTVTGWDAVLKLNWPITKFQKVREGFEPADWIKQKPKTTPTEIKKRLIKKPRSSEI